VNNSQKTCDRERIELFLGQKLSDEEQTAFELHLDDCDDCRRRLEATAARDDIWSGVRDALVGQQLPADSLPADDSALDSATGGDAAFSHNTVLALLAPTDDDRMIGRLGTYEIVGVIGSGGMGVVLKAFDGALNRYVAIKVLAPHLGNSGAARKRFSREAQAAAAVVHDNVMEIHGVADADGLPYLVMPYVRGPSLQRRFDNDGPLALVEILRIGMQAASGLAAAHAQGLVHRDVKPANILLADGVERVKLTDFGLARAGDDASLTRTGIIAGTPQYMSPEQARGESVDQRSDLFSLGSVLYAMCTGRAPFRAETSYGVLRRITDEEPRPIGEINPDIPEWLSQIIAKLMSKEPGDRFESASEVAELLEECLAHVQQPTAVPLPKSRLFAGRNQPHRASGRLLREAWTSARRLIPRRSIGVITMIAVLGFALLGVFLWQSTDPPDIAGRWTGEGWGNVALERTQPGKYDGTYTDTSDEQDGTIELKWSRIERRFNGSWREGRDRYGKISVRLVGDEIRGAWTTNKKSKIVSGTPRLADLLWVKKSETPKRTDAGGRLVIKPGPIRVETSTEMAAFEACLKQPIRTVNFDDVDTSHPDPVPFDSERYAASAGIIIRGTRGQYVDESFALPDDLIPKSSPNMYVPGPKAKAFRRSAQLLSEPSFRPIRCPSSLGGNRTQITFVSDGSAAAVAGFGAVFIDADYPKSGPCRIRAFDCSGDELVSWSGFSGENRSKLFRGIVALNDKGQPVPAIARIEIINGSEWPHANARDAVALDDFVFSTPVAADIKPQPVATMTPDGGHLVVQPSSVGIEASSDRDAFAVRLKQTIRRVDFDDVDTSDAGPVPFESDRYASTAGIVIKGTEGQYAVRSFGGDTMKPGSPPNMYAPGPLATSSDPPPRGGHRSEITFVANGSKAVVAGFGAVFIDADWPRIGPCTIRAFDRRGKELGSWTGFSGPDGSKLFRGIIAVDDKGQPVPAIARIEMINGNEWPSVGIGEGVPLDDFVFSAPMPIDNAEAGDEIRGAWTTDKNSQKGSGTPRLADLLPTRSSGNVPGTVDRPKADVALSDPSAASELWQGNWTMVRSEGSERVVPIAMTIDGDQLNIIWSKPRFRVSNGDLILDPSQPRPTFVFHHHPNRVGIYRFDERTKRLTICYRMSSSTMADVPPRNFDVGDDLDCTLCVLEKAPGTDSVSRLVARVRPATPEQIKSDSTKLVGTWVLEGTERSSEPDVITIEGLDSFLVDGVWHDVQPLRFTDVGGNVKEVLLGIYPNASPPRFRTYENGGGRVRREWHGVYELSNNTLTLNFQGLSVIGGRGPIDWSRGGEGKDSPRHLKGTYHRAEDAEPQPKTTTATPKRVHHFQHLTTGNSVKTAYSADGKLIAIANGNPTSILLRDGWKPSADILDAGTGETVVSLKLTTNDEDTLFAATGRSHFEVTALAFSPVGNLVAVGTDVGQVKLFNARTGELVRSLDDQREKLADKKAPENLKSFTRAMGSVTSLEFSPDGSLLAMSGRSFDDSPLVWESVQRLGEFSTGPGRLKVWEVKTGTLKHDLVGHSQAYAVSFSPNGNLLASAGRWGERVETGAIIWNPHTGTKMRTFGTTANGGTHSVAFSPDSKLAAIGSQRFDKDKWQDASTGAVKLAHVASGITDWVVTVPGWAKPVAFSPDGKTVAVLCGGQSIRFLETETGKLLHEIGPADSTQGGRWYDFAVASQCHTLAIGGRDAEKQGFVEVWITPRQPKTTAAMPNRLDDLTPGDGVKVSPGAKADDDVAQGEEVSQGPSIVLHIPWNTPHRKVAGILEEIFEELEDFEVKHAPCVSTDEGHPTEIIAVVETARLTPEKELSRVFDRLKKAGVERVEFKNREATVDLLVETVDIASSTGAMAGDEVAPVEEKPVAPAELDADQPEESALKRAADLAPPVRIMAGGRPIVVGSFAASFVGDYDGDGKNDLLVGQYVSGRLRIYRNVGTNAQPRFGTFEWFKAGGRIAGVRPYCQVSFTPQLVDFDGDGRTDILTGSGIGGEVFLFRRKADQTFDEAEVLQNREGQVQMHRWLASGRSRPRSGNVTALAYDWDKDGDLDLLLGYLPLCLVLNEGTAREPSFDGGRLIECEGEPIIGGLRSPHMADWDGDGLDDLLAGLDRNIVWYRNIGQPDRPEFGAPRVLVPSLTLYPNIETPDGQPGPHHTFCVADFNADGRLDLLLSDRFRGTIDEDNKRELTVADRDRQNALYKLYKDLRDEPEGETREERIERYRRQLRTWQEYAELRLATSRGCLHRGYVWFYERIAPAEVNAHEDKPGASAGIPDVDQQASADAQDPKAKALPVLKVRTVNRHGQPIAGLHVHCYDGEIIWSARPNDFEEVLGSTDKDGWVDLGGLPKEFVCVRVDGRKGTFSSSECRIFEGEDGFRQKTNRLVEIKSNRETVTLVFTMRRRVDLAFNVIDSETEKIIPNSFIYVKEEQRKRWWTLSRIYGNGYQHDYSTIVEEIGDAQFRVAALGYYPVDFRLEEKLEIGKKTVQRIEITAAPEIRFTVLTPDGKPAEGARFDYIALKDLPCTARRATISDSDGALVVDYPAQGDLTRIELTHESGQAVIAVKDLPDPTTVIEDGESKDIIPIEVRLSREDAETEVGEETLPELKVHVLDKDGKPVAGATVWVYDRNHYMAGMPVDFEDIYKNTGKDGWADLGVLPQHFLCVQVFGEDNRFDGNYIDIAKANGTFMECPDNPFVSMESDDDAGTLAITFNMRQGVDLKFEALDAETGKELRYAGVHYWDELGKRWWQPVMAERARQHNFWPMTEDLSDKPFRIASPGYYPVDFELEEKLELGKQYRREIELTPAPNIRFRIFTPDGKPADGAKFKWSNPEGIGDHIFVENWTDGVLETRYPAHGDLATFEVTHQSGKAAVAARDLPKPVTVLEEGQRKTIIEYEIQLLPPDTETPVE